MKVTLDLETSVITVPKQFFEKIAKENDVITSHGGQAVTPSDRIKNAFNTAMADTDKYLVTKK